MSWQHGQPDGIPFGQPAGSGRPLGLMGMAAFLASNKGFAEEAAHNLLRELEKVPADIDMTAFQQGVVRYMGQGARPARVEYPVVAQNGRFCLRDAGGEGSPVVLVPSMVNRGYILDLHPQASLVGFLKEAGHHVLLVDWGVAEAGNVCTLEQVVLGLEALLEAAVALTRPVGVFGYCMGGLLALAATVRVNKSGEGKVCKLALAAMPWDFAQTVSAEHMRLARPLLEPWLGAQQTLPPEVMGQYFWSLDVWGPIRRIMAYGRESDPERLAQMTALEDWLGDGLPLDGPVAREMLLGWYADNAPMRGLWLVDGTVIDPKAVGCPLWVCITQKDVLVPTASSLAFLGQAQGAAHVVMADCGHVGLVAGRNCRRVLYEPLGAFFRTNRTGD